MLCRPSASRLLPSVVTVAVPPAAVALPSRLPSLKMRTVAPSRTALIWNCSAAAAVALLRRVTLSVSTLPVSNAGNRSISPGACRSLSPKFRVLDFAADGDRDFVTHGIAG